MKTDDVIISARGLGRVFKIGSKEIRAVNDIEIDICRGQFVGLTGRSGSGKTTLLNMLAGLDLPSTGKVLFDGQQLDALKQSKLLEIRRNKIGFVFQSFALLPLLSAYENVELPLRILGIPRKERAKMVNTAIGLVKLTDRASHRPYELSGGEQQRTAIARAVVHRPLLLIADEPTGELDSVNAKGIFSLLKDVCQNEGVTVIVASHDPAVVNFADPIYNMIDGAIIRP